MNIVLENERAMDNFILEGLTSSFIGAQDLITWASELNHGVNGSLIDKITIVPIVYSDHFAEVLSVVSGWLGSGVMHIDDFTSYDSQRAMDSWLAGKSIFLRATPSMLAQAKNAAFEYGTFPMPLYTSQPQYGVSAIQGYYVGVNGFSKKQAAAVKTLEYLTSLDYQTYVATHGLAPKTTPAYPSLFQGYFCS